MGVCQSKEVRRQLLVNKQIERELRKDQENEAGQVKLLLLGAGECGKSTILKQMQLLHSNGFSEEEIQEKKEVVYSNVITSMSAMLKAMDTLDITLEEAEREIDAKVIFRVLDSGEEHTAFTDEVYNAVKRLWQDKGILQCFDRRSEYQLNDNAKYFLNEIDRIHQPAYRPTVQDILQSRVATTGVVEVQFKIKGLDFRVFDVGGQRSERRKWIHCFDNVDSIIFISAISEYDQVLFEDDSTNRMLESMQLFSSICNSAWFQQTSMILFLNKKDLFAEKIQRVSIKSVFPDYEGPQEYESCVKYIGDKFKDCSEDPNKQIYLHETCATDTNQVQLVLNGVIDTIIQKNMKSSGIV